MPTCDIKTRYFPATFAWTLLLGTTILFFYFPCQYYLFRQPWVPVYQGVITFFVLANFTLATFMDPGVIPKAPPDEDREDDFRAPLYKSVEINGIMVRMKWCVTCKFYRPPRCSHCSVCNHCIETFDHHCPWVNNCIGRRNYRFFFFFLLSLSIHMISIFSLSLVYVLHSKEKLTNVEPIMAMVIMGIVALLAIPIFGLTGFHMVLVSRGRTTNEQVTGKFKGGYNPFSRGCWYNCCYTQFGPQYPSLARASKPHKSERADILLGGANGGGGGAGISTIAAPHVKTYTADNNGTALRPTAAGPHAHYNKLSLGRDAEGPGGEADGAGDTEAPGASQSADCEATPPAARPPQPPPFRRPFAYVPQAQPPPPHPALFSYPRLSPHARTRVMEPSVRGYGGVNELVEMGGMNSAPTRPSPTMQQRIKALGVPTPIAMSSPVRRSNPGTPTQTRRPEFGGGDGGDPSPPRRFPSEGEGGGGVRELAASPQRGGNYAWPPSPAPRRRPAPPPAPPPAPSAAGPRPARPLSFVRALRVSDALDAAPPAAPANARADAPDRASLYDCNYEISV